MATFTAGSCISHFVEGFDRVEFFRVLFKDGSGFGLHFLDERKGTLGLRQVSVFSLGISSSPYILNYFIQEKEYLDLYMRGDRDVILLMCTRVTQFK